MSTLPVGDACSNIIVHDVDRANFEVVWPALLRNMENAEFIALDTVRAYMYCRSVTNLCVPFACSPFYDRNATLRMLVDFIIFFFTV